MSHFLAIDQSTSATKAIVFDAAGRLIEKASLEHKQIYPQPGWVEHDAEEIWRNTQAAIARLNLRDVKCLSITNQRETIIVFDRATGKPLHNAIVWQCRRGAPMCAELSRAGHDAMVARKTGLKIDTYFSASKLTWLLRNKPEIASRLRDGSAVIGTIDTFLIHRLTHGKVFATDHTNASRTLLFDISSLKWDSQLCELFDAPLRALPDVRDSTGKFGEATIVGAGEKQVTVPICGVIGDSQASLFAHQCLAPGMAKVTIGTGSSVLLNLGPQLRDGGDAAVATIAWTHAGKPTYSFEGIVNYSAATLEWLRKQLGLIQDASECEAAATSIADNGGVYLVPAFAGLSAPYWSPDARAAMVGLSAHSTRNHIIRAALESIAYQIRDVLDAMRDRGGVKLTTIHADGGATRNRFLMQFIADITRLKIAAADVAECSPLGAAMAGMLGSGFFKSIGDLSRIPHEAQMFEPKMPQEESDRLHAGWQRAVKQVLAGVEA